MQKIQKERNGYADITLLVMRAGKEKHSSSHFKILLKVPIKTMIKTMVMFAVAPALIHGPFDVKKRIPNLFSD